MDAILLKLCVGFPQAAVLQALLQCGYIPWNPPFRNCSITNSHGQQLPQSSCSSTGSSPWATALAQSYFCGGPPCALSSFRPHTLLHFVLLHDYKWRSSLYGAHGLQGGGPLLRPPLGGRGQLLLCGWGTSRLPPGCCGPVPRLGGNAGSVPGSSRDWKAGFWAETGEEPTGQGLVAGGEKGRSPGSWTSVAAQVAAKVFPEGQPELSYQNSGKEGSACWSSRFSLPPFSPCFLKPSFYSLHSNERQL